MCLRSVVLLRPTFVPQEPRLLTELKTGFYWCSAKGVDGVSSASFFRGGWGAGGGGGGVRHT